MQGNSDRVLIEWLVLNVQAGSSVALEQLLKRCYPGFLRYSSYQLQNREAAKDVVQETMLVIAKTIMRLKDPAAFPRWSYQILHRRGVDHQRREIRQRRVESEVSVASLEQFESDSEMSETLSAALRNLNELSYNMIHLRYLHGLSVKEIAAICDVPEGTVKSRLHAAREKLRETLSE